MDGNSGNGMQIDDATATLQALAKQGISLFMLQRLITDPALARKVATVISFGEKIIVTKHCTRDCPEYINTCPCPRPSDICPYGLG